ncbi:MAG: dienelactone hydrolase family protein [Steroidobacteraceae bacterium]|jgi:dienelactone hydrolase
MHSQSVKYQADGLDMDSELFYEPGADRRPAVLVFPEIFGLGEHALARARRLCSLGYVAMACDLHGARRVFDDKHTDEVMMLMQPIRKDVARIRARAQGALDALSARAEVDPARIGAIGFCFGGTVALELARAGAPIVGVVGFHSGLATVAPQDARNIRAKILVCIGADDPGIPPEQRAAFEQEMRAAQVDWQLVLYGGVVHSFTNPEADRRGRLQFQRYDARADARSWQQMCAFLEEIFRPASATQQSV